jgi:hypothetical protein
VTSDASSGQSGPWRSAPRTSQRAEAEPPLAGDAYGAFALAVLLVCAGIAVGDQTVGLAVGFLAFLCLLYAMTRVPLRISISVLAFLQFALENPTEGAANGVLASPAAVVGSVLMQHLNNTTGIRALFFSGNDVLIVSLLVIAGLRRSSGSRIDRVGGFVATPRPLVKLAYLSLAGTAYTWVVGMMRGGSFAISLWQLDRVMYVPLVFLLCHLGLRGPRDALGLAKAALAGACVKTGFAVWVVASVVPKKDAWGQLMEVACPTDHSTSILFATATVILGALLVERAGRRRFMWVAVLLPIFVTGMIYNRRRMVWVEIALVFVTLYFITPPNPVKRRIKRAALILLPVALIYLRVGWYSQASIFKPAQTVRSVIDPDYDPTGSSQTRKIENYNLTYTMGQFPVLGAGYGNGYWQIIPLPEMGYPLEPYCPHNSILGLWVFCGLIGYLATTMLWVGGIFFAFRAHINARAPPEKATALVSFGAILVYMLQAWGDMGLGSWIGVFTVAPAAAMAGKLAVAVGGWNPRARPASQAPAPTPAPTGAAEGSRA